MLTGARDPEAAAWALARDGREVVITLGAGGALWSDGEHVERAAGEPGAREGLDDRRGRRVHGGLARLPPRRSGAGRGAGGGQLRRRAARPLARERARRYGRAPGGPRISMPCSAATRGEDLGRDLVERADVDTKRSKPDGTLETSDAAPSAPTS